MIDSERVKGERALELGLSVITALIAVTCAGSGALEHGPIAPLTPASASAPPPSAAAVVALGTPARAEPNPVPSARALDLARPPVSDPNRLDLPHFYGELSALDQGQRDSAVRILWLGDSHTAADYLTGALRSRLQARFAAGGPGFVRVGMKPYRHSQVRWSCDGPWKVEPVPPPRRTLFDDGVFGLGGVRTLPDPAPTQASFEVNPGAARGRLHWQLWFSLKNNASFRVTLAGGSRVVTQASAVPALPGAGFASLALDSELSDKLEVVTLSGAPRFYGLTVEGSQPGVVLDAVGIDGARVATTLAWAEGSFEAAVRERPPSLVAIAFGTNEAFDADKLETYRMQYESLRARVRLAAPNSDCLIVGPPDAVAVTGGSEPRVAAIDALQGSIAAELGCGYLSQLAIMGGPGGYSRWARESPPLAHGDRLHLTAKGYQVVGNTIADRLLEAYERAPH